MGWAIGYDADWKRDIGYGVHAICDHPDCNEEIDRGLSYVCGNDPYGGEHGCGLYFCGEHLEYAEVEKDYEARVCERCANQKDPFDAKPDSPQWIEWKLTDKSWRQWRDENPEEVKKLRVINKTA